MTPRNIEKRLIECGQDLGCDGQCLLGKECPSAWELSAGRRLQKPSCLLAPIVLASSNASETHFASETRKGGNRGEYPQLQRSLRLTVALRKGPSSILSSGSLANLKQIPFLALPSWEFCPIEDDT